VVQQSGLRSIPNTSSPSVSSTATSGSIFSFSAAADETDDGVSNKNSGSGLDDCNGTTLLLIEASEGERGRAIAIDDDDSATT